MKQGDLHSGTELTEATRGELKIKKIPIKVSKYLYI
jgi:hypothetical protein